MKKVTIILLEAEMDEDGKTHRAWLSTSTPGREEIRVQEFDHLPHAMELLAITLTTAIMAGIEMRDMINHPQGNA